MAKFLFALGAFAVLALAGAAVWQSAEKSSHEDSADRHESAATTLQAAAGDGVAAGALLQQYVQSGDPSLLPQMQAKTDDGVRKLTAAMREAGGDPSGFVQTSSGIVQRAGQVIALRQTGDVQGAANVLAALGEEFTAFVQQQQEFIDGERAAAAAETASADDAGSLATWFAIAAVILAIVEATAGGFMLLRGLARRRATQAVPS